MGSKQTNKKDPCSGKHDGFHHGCKPKRTRQYSIQSHDTGVSCMSQETATTGLSFETDSIMSASKRSCARSVSFCLSNENEDIEDESSNELEIRDSDIGNDFNDNNSLRLQSNNSADRGYSSIPSEKTVQEAMPRHVFPVNKSRGCCCDSFSDKYCMQPLVPKQSTFSCRNINEHPQSEAWYAGLERNFKDTDRPYICNFDHRQCQKLCSSIKTLKRVVIVLCVFNLILLIAFIIGPIFAVLYFKASNESNPVTGQLTGTVDQQKQGPSCVKCESLLKNLPTFIKTQNVIKSFEDENGRCCVSDPGTLMTILNQISEEAIERAKGSACISCPSGISEGVITPAVHLKSRGNGLINASDVFIRKSIESTHFIGWQRSVAKDHQGLWGRLNENGASIRITSPGMYFIYAMIQQAGSNIDNSVSANMNTTTFGIPRAPLKVALYICPHGTGGDQGHCYISAISQKYIPSDNGAQQHTYFGRLFYLKENENVYLGISGDNLIHQESESHYLGFYKV